jgi:hypothetical protein
MRETNRAEIIAAIKEVGVSIAIMSAVVLALSIGSCQKSPGGELEEALSSVRTLPAEERTNTRFLSLETFAPEDRGDAASVASFVLNSLSNSGAISRPQWATGTLLRFNLRQFSGTEERYKAHWQAWEDMAAVDYVFHMQTQVAEKPAPLKGDKKGNVVAEPVVRTVTLDAPWLDAKVCQELRTETASIGPVIRLEQWIAAVTVPPFYYRMAGIPETEKEFLLGLGIDQKVIATLDADKGANVISQVALGRVRRVVSLTGPHGDAWQTKDVTVSRGDRDAVRQPLTRSVNPTTGQAVTLFTYDAGEWIASQANGLHQFALYDREGKRQDAVPLGGPGKSIARDYSEQHPGFDGVVVPMLSCVRCHTEDGLRPLPDIQATLPGVAGLKDAQELLSFYNPPQVQLRLKQGRERYSLAVQQACDLNAQQVADALAKIVRTHDYALVTIERAALELGVPPVVAQEAFSVSTDPHLILMSQGHAVHRDNWRDSYGAAAMMLKEAQQHVAESK